MIPAAGQARRFGSGDKLAAGIGGVSVLERTLATFDGCSCIDAIVVVAPAAGIDHMRAAAEPFARVVAVVAGGDTRGASVRNGLAALPVDCTVALVHDAARPLVTPDLVARIAEAARGCGAVPGIPVRDTVKRVDADRRVRATVARSEAADSAPTSLAAVQTPQGAPADVLRAAYAAWDSARGEPTDEASVLEAAGVPVMVIDGEAENIKITVSADLAAAERILEARAELALPAVRTGFGYDVHAFAPADSGRPLMLGGVHVPGSPGLAGHSDADVVLHAICDALLGAAGLGDIGNQFPNTDERWRGAASGDLLRSVHHMVLEAGWAPVNVDAAVLAEAPKLAPHRDEMRSAIAACLELAVDAVNVKATTSEGLGFVGRREGIACWAVATVRPVAGRQEPGRRR